MIGARDGVVDVGRAAVGVTLGDALAEGCCEGTEERVVGAGRGGVDLAGGTAGAARPGGIGEIAGRGPTAGRTPDAGAAGLLFAGVAAPDRGGNIAGRIDGAVGGDVGAWAKDGAAAVAGAAGEATGGLLTAGGVAGIGARGSRGGASTVEGVGARAPIADRADDVSAGIDAGPNSSSTGLPAPTVMTPPHTEHRARTPDDGIFAGSTR